VTEDLRRRLESGEWDSGEALPSVGKLADHYSASRTTIGKALKVLESDGLVTIVPRWGTFRA
jgi:GntR family transcriptional regulator